MNKITEQEHQSLIDEVMDNLTPEDIAFLTDLDKMSAEESFQFIMKQMDVDFADCPENFRKVMLNTANQFEDICEEAESHLSEHNIQRYKDAFSDFMPFLGDRIDECPPFYIESPESLKNSDDSGFVGDLITWREWANDSITIEKVKFYKQNIEGIDYLIMPLPASSPDPEDSKYKLFALCMRVNSGREFMFLPEVIKHYIIEFHKVAYPEQVSSTSAVLYCPPPAVLEDFNCLTAFNRGAPFRTNYHDFVERNEDDELNVYDYGKPIFYVNNHSSKGNPIVDAIVELSPRVWLEFVEYKD
jgi:hypothetical protein